MPLSPSTWTAVGHIPAAGSDDLALPDPMRRHVGRERVVDAAVLVLAVVLGALFLTPELHDNPDPWSTRQIAVDVAGGVVACAALWWRRRWPVGVAVLTMLAGVVSSSATPAGLLALSSLAVHRPVRPTVLVGLLWVPSLLAYAAYSPTTGPGAVVAFVMPLVLAACGWGMFIRARRQLLLSLRERALRAEADQELHEEQARTAERTRIAREMHDVLAHRISMIALHAGGLELRPDLPSAEIRETAVLLRSTAGQALEELRSVIGVLREGSVNEPVDVAPQPALGDIPRLVEETRRAGMDIEFEMDVAQDVQVPAPLGRDAYRIVQEALTNIGKHARGTPAAVRVAGAPVAGLHISVRNPQPSPARSDTTLPGAGAGLVGLRERVALAGGTLSLGADEVGNFVVEADLPWHP
ncbi:histidine kinase [Nocardioides sp. STR2]|uniref:histidine kinase n=1 Tax=Nocardioides pini TaxID=2975053 RepID=A0ABT4CKW0_9ACTN|nr:histidine kinase [Nocardioides pini]MCY4728547.1 histidine kinase [Nocardioides pini]